MVIFFNKRPSSIILIICLLISFNAKAVENPSNLNTITVNLINPKKTIEYGKFLKIKINIIEKENINIAALLKPLNENFIYSEVSNSTSGQYVSHIIRLYPLHQGAIIIPTLKYQEAKTAAIDITVVSAKSENKQPILIQTNKVNPIPWVREQTKILITIITADKGIQLSNQNIKLKGNDSYLIPHTVEKITLNHKLLYKHTIGWNVFFLYGQNINIELPFIEYSKDGVPRYKFYVPKPNIHVKELPIYISPTIPVGKISLDSRYLALPKTLLQTNMISIIQYSLTGEDIPAKWLPSISQNYINIKNAKINFSHIQTKLNTKVMGGNVQGNKTSEIAFSPQSNGLLPIDDIQFQYFDPKTGLLKFITFKHNKLLVLDWFFQIILALPILFISYRLMFRISIFIKQLINKTKYHSQCKIKVQNAKTYQDIKVALDNFSIAEQWSKNMTLKQWLQQVEHKYTTSNQLTEICDDLNKKLYSNFHSIELEIFDSMKRELLTILKKIKRKSIIQRLI